MNKKYYTIFLLLTTMLSSSCLDPVTNQDAQNVESTSSNNATPIILSEPTVHHEPTAIPNPTDAALYFSPDQITDGTLRFTIKEVEPICHNWKEPIAIQMTFKNLTFGSINIVKVSETGRGFMVEPILTQLHRHIRYCLDCVGLADSFSGPPPVLFDILPALGVVKSVIWYRILGLEVEISQGDFMYATPEPGSYFLKFVYHNEDKFSNDVWTGEIASNQIEICISE